MLWQPRIPWYDGVVRTDAKSSQRKSARFLQDYEEYTCRVGELNEQGDDCFTQLTVSELLPPFVQHCLAQVFIEIGCNISDSEFLTALAKHGGEYVRPTRKMQTLLPLTGESRRNGEHNGFNRVRKRTRLLEQQKVLRQKRQQQKERKKRQQQPQLPQQHVFAKTYFSTPVSQSIGTLGHT